MSAQQFPLSHTAASLSQHGLKKCSKAPSKLVTSAKLVFKWSESCTCKNNVIKTKDLRCDIHRDISRPGWAIAKIQVNQYAKDPGARTFLRKGNKGSGHKTPTGSSPRFHSLKLILMRLGFEIRLRVPGELTILMVILWQRALDLSLEAQLPQNGFGGTTKAYGIVR
ncbi:hypothetical protein B0O99DRAFT_599773 [Bisporella sp. PMI_857]|nr:hypothetical protein B0O99DRAFT_599773 [Bisporella sp. PMI_857]